MTLTLRKLPGIGILACALLLSCGGSSNICDCSPTQPDSSDYRHNAKHIPLPSGTPQLITVQTILNFPQIPSPPTDAPRTGRELQLFEVAKAYLQLAYVFNGDCDIHMEIADSPSKTAPRVIVETPVDEEYCSARMKIQSQISSHGDSLGNSLANGELPQPFAVQVIGLAFEDFPHNRGSQFVQTVWELHPAIVLATQ